MGNEELLGALKKIKISADSENVDFWLLGGLAHAFHAGRLYREFGDLDLLTKDKAYCNVFCDLLEKLGYKKIGEKNIADGLIVYVYENVDGVNVDISYYTGDFGLKKDDLEENGRELEGISLKVLSKRFCKSYKEYLINVRDKENDVLDLKMLSE